MNPLKPGDVLRNRYTIVEVIGQGGMGCVYKAADRRLDGRFTAVKDIRPGVDRSPDEREQDRRQFQREASILARLDHPNLPKVSDFFSQDDGDFLVMDYVPGVDLRRVINESIHQGRPPAEAQVLDWAAQLIDALCYLHSRIPPVLHRDIKPANIKVTPDGIVKLVDFGMVQAVPADEQRTITIVQGGGTAPYTPLEQIGGDLGRADPRSDLYALGATLYHLLTLVPPPDARERFLDPAVLRDPREHIPAMRERTAHAVLWAMALHPADRPPDARTFSDVLFGGGALPSRRATPGLPRAGCFAPQAADLKPGNVVLAVLAAVLLVLALLVTILSPVF